METIVTSHKINDISFISQLIRFLRAGASVLEKRRDSGHRPDVPTGLLKPEPKAEAEVEEEDQVSVT